MTRFCNSKSRKASGFTLLELLVVTAVNAVIALIVVINLSDARTRSKVARAHADLLTATTALETYRVDQSAYLYPAYRLGENQWTRLTSPIAYLTSSDSMRDVFGPWTDEDESTLTLHYYWYIPYAHMVASSSGNNPNLQFWTTYYGPYAVKSIGPGGRNLGDTYQDYTISLRYDPTNGTSSPGWIIRAPNLKHY